MDNSDSEHDKGKEKKHKKEHKSHSSDEKDKKKDPHREIAKYYSLKKELGRGAFSVVRLAVNRKTKEKVAIKIIEKKNIGKEFEKNLRMEVAILQRVHHPNIIDFMEVLESSDYIYFVMELITGGELFDRIVEKGCYSENDARNAVAKIVSAVAYLHSQGIAHRDLKPENLLVKSLDDDTEVKLADFGLSKIIDQEKIMQTACGTPGYVAPEVLQAQGYDKEVDLWAVGVITYILLCGFPPFYSDNVSEVFEQILKAEFDFPDEYWKPVSTSAKDFIRALLVVDPKKRLTAVEALDHPWIKADLNSANLGNLNKMKSYNALRKADSQKLIESLNNV